MFKNVGISSLPIETPVESAGKYYVELHRSFGKTTVFEGELDGPLTVQTALERSGAIKKYRGMNIALFRIVKENGRNLKLPVEYGYRTKTVAPEKDYSLHPGDRIVVAPKSSSPLDKVLDSLNRD